MTGSVFLPIMDFVADPVSVTGYLKEGHITINIFWFQLSKFCLYVFCNCCICYTFKRINANKSCFFLCVNLVVVYPVYKSHIFPQDTVNHMVLIFIDDSPVSDSNKSITNCSVSLSCQVCFNNVFFLLHICMLFFC